METLPPLLLSAWVMIRNVLLAAISLTARRYASAVYAVAVCLSVCLSYADIVPKRLNIPVRKQRHTIDQGL